MKKIKSLSLLFVCVLVLSLSCSWKVFAAVSLPAISSSKPITCYTMNASGRVYAYTSSALREKTGGYIDCATDECKILNISGNAVQVRYPVSGGTRTAWFARSAFSSCNIAGGALEKWTQISGITAYRRSDGRTTLGSISVGDVCYKLAVSGNYTQAVYPISGGYKMGWIKTSEIRKNAGTNTGTNTGTKDGNIVIGNVTLDYALGDYFTDNGKECTTKCHRNDGHAGKGGYTDEKYCNCKCTATIGNKTYKLGAVQCMGFARYVQSALYGTNSHLSSKSFTKTGAVSKSKLTTSKLKSMITSAGVGAHIRTGSPGHSMIVSKVTGDGFTVIQCNGSNSENYESNGRCRIGIKTYTWNSYINSIYGQRGISFIETFKK